MLDIFRGLKTLIRVSHVHIDSAVFRLHYSITVLILIAFSLIITTRQYVGNPIDCIHTKDIPEDVLNTFCWIHSTYTVKDEVKKTETYQGYPGVKTTISEKDKKLYRYYQWVCFCLFFQVSNKLVADMRVKSLSYFTYYRRRDISLFIKRLIIPNSQANYGLRL